MTRAQLEKIVSDIDRDGSYPWKHELHDIWDHDLSQREEIARLREALENFVDQFECDFVLDDGTIVDNPPERWRPIEQCYKLAKSALAKEATRD